MTLSIFRIILTTRVASWTCCCLPISAFKHLLALHVVRALLQAVDAEEGAILCHLSRFDRG